jgi:hypothetical protein
MNAPACIYCGCTEAHACPRGCAWSPYTTRGHWVCTACVDLVEQLGCRLNSVAGRAHLGWVAFDFLCSAVTGPRAQIFRWTGPALESLPGGPPPASWRKLRVPPVGGSKTPSPAAPAKPRKRTPAPAPRPPRRKTVVSETGRRR